SISQSNQNRTAHAAAVTANRAIAAHRVGQTSGCWEEGAPESGRWVGILPPIVRRSILCGRVTCADSPVGVESFFGLEPRKNTNVKDYSGLVAVMSSSGRDAREPVRHRHAVAMGRQPAMIWLYFAATCAVMMAGIAYLRVISSSESLLQDRLARAAIHRCGAAMILLFFALIIGGFLLGPWWGPILALIIGGVATALMESGVPFRTKRQ